MTSISSTLNLGAMTMIRGAHHLDGARDAGQLAEQLFSKLDSSGQGYLKKADLQAVLNDGSQAAKRVTPGDLDALFTGFDADGDGKLTKQEFTDSVKKLADQLTQQLRMKDAQATAQNSGALAPPAPADGTCGFTKDGTVTASATDAAGPVDTKAQMMMQLMKLLQVYGGSSEEPHQHAATMQPVTV